MSASSSHRFIRLIGKIAEEKASRNRTVTTAKPKLARRYTTSVGSAPQDRGSPAELGSFQIAFDLAEPMPRPLEHRVRQLVYREYVIGGTYIDHPVGATYDPIVASLELIKGLDYPDYLAAFSDAESQREHKSEMPSLQAPEVDLIDRLFGGKWAGAANQVPS